MANVERFNKEIDKITEREVVFDFVSRLTIGKDFINQDYNNTENTNDRQFIFNDNAKLKDDILANIIRTLDTSDIHNLSKIKTAYKTIGIGEKSVSIAVPLGCTLYRIIQEKTGQDVTKCFEPKGNVYTAEFDTPSTHIDTYKAYFRSV